ncbi:glycosyltransferase family 39 protein [Candidatus Daviesbacteria bacterium]|nr:glycosyltransferase family 39 protein [Candidatus Daviesbacteria bacterium]
MLKINFKVAFLFLFSTIILWSLLTYKLTDVPPAINGDEVHIGYNATLIADTAYDQNGKFMPIFVSDEGKTDWKQPITLYSTVTAFKIFGPSFFILRAVSVLFTLVSCLLLFLLVKNMLNIKTAIVAVVIFVTSPIVMIQSHLALENIAPVPFIIFSLLMFVKYLKSLNTKLLIFAGMSLGISFYSYLGMRLIAPMLGMLLLAFIVYLHKKEGRGKIIKPLLFFILGTLPFVILIPILKQMYPGAILAENRPQSISSYQQFLLPFLSIYDLSFLYLKGDATLYHSTGKHGILLLASLPLFLIGAYKSILDRSKLLIFLLISFFILPVLYGLTDSIYRGSRILAIIPLYSIISAYGFIAFSKYQAKLRKYVLVIFIVFFFVNYFDFLSYYWGDYANRSRLVFDGGAYPAYKNLYFLSKKMNIKPFVEIGVYGEETLASSFFDRVYFNNRLNKIERYTKLPEPGIVLVHDSDMQKYIDLGFKEMPSDFPYYKLMWQN